MSMQNRTTKRFCKTILTVTLLAAGMLSRTRAAESRDIKVTGLVQSWTVIDGKPGAPDGFSVRRAEIKFSGQAHPLAGWFIMIDPAKPINIKTAAQGGTLVSAQADPKSMILKDVGIVISGWEKFPNVSLQVGQFKPPFGMEGIAPSSELDLIARSSLCEALGWSDYRDIGAMVKYKRGALTAFMGVFNGEGPNTADANKDRDFAARIVLMPTGNLHLGIAGYHGRGKAARYLNERAGAEFAWLSDRWFLKAELAGGHGATSSSSSPGMRTVYVSAGRMLGTKLQGVARFDRWDPDTSAGHDVQSETALGANYLIDGHKFKVQLNYVLHDQEGAAGSYEVTRAAMQLTF